MSKKILTHQGKPIGEPVEMTDKSFTQIYLEDPFQHWLKQMNTRIAGITLLPDRILKSGNYTIVFWADDTKTLVKRADDEPDNEYAAFTAALAKKIYGSNNAIKKIIEKKTEVQKPKDDKD